MAQDTPVIYTKKGALKGSIYKSVYGDTIYTYQGIPYGEPPVGPLRFKNPVPAKSWEGVKLAQTAPPPSPAGWMNPQGNFEEMPGQSEDCLYLNVFTPEGIKPNSKLPVMTWIHGGGFTLGTGNQTWYGPDYLVPQGVVLVNINYRLGALGFLSFETPECSGNYGLKDQNLGLRWVKENIEAFGGDPNNITLFGESAGGASVHYHSLSPLSRGLFNRAIALSGCALTRWAYSRHARKSSMLLAKKLGCPSEDPKDALEFLRNAPLKNILITAPTIFSEVESIWAGEETITFGFVPTKEPEDTPGAFLTKTPLQATMDGDMADVPFITGVTDAEAVFFALPSPDYVPDINSTEVLEKLLPKELELTLGTEKTKLAAEKVKNFYFPNGPSQDGVIRALSLSFLVRPILNCVRIKKNKTTPNYIYRFDATRNPSAMKKFFQREMFEGSCHCDDLEYLFYIPEGTLAGKPIERDTEEERVKNTFTKLLTDFAKSGNLPKEWKPVEGETDISYAKITDNLEFKDGFFAEEIQLWDDVHAMLTKE